MLNCFLRSPRLCSPHYHPFSSACFFLPEPPNPSIDNNNRSSIGSLARFSAASMKSKCYKQCHIFAVEKNGKCVSSSVRNRRPKLEKHAHAARRNYNKYEESRNSAPEEFNTYSNTNMCEFNITDFRKAFAMTSQNQQYKYARKVNMRAK